MKLLVLILFILPVSSAFGQSSVYDFKVRAVGGEEIDFTAFRGKPIVLVNIASGSERSKQMEQLHSLCWIYAADSLIVVAFPSNDFSNETRSNEEIRLSVKNFHRNFFIATKTSVKGENRSSIYKWCTSKSSNGMMDSEVRDDFQKFIVNKEGILVGAFSGSVGPLDEPFLKAMKSVAQK